MASAVAAMKVEESSVDVHGYVAHLEALIEKMQSEGY
jgi:hypothetical protein